MNIAKNIVHSFSHLFYPHTCAGCGSDLLGAEQLLCLQCIDQLPFTYFHLHADNPVEKIFRGRVDVVNAMSLLYFTKDSVLQNLLHLFKYKGRKDIGLYFGRMMGNALLESGQAGPIDAIVPLPLFASREKRRGYNQATVLCEGIAAITGLPVMKDALTRITATETQTHKNRMERWQNIEGRFALKDNTGLENKHLLLVDDVITTGATLEACASVLAAPGSAKISIATLAYTVSGNT